MILGPIMIVAGASGLLGIYVNEVKKSRPKKEKEQTITDKYAQLFENLGLMNSKKGDWIKCHGLDVREFYSKVKFTISDSLSVVNFKNATEKLREKLKVINLEVYEDEGYMYFRSRKPELPTINYEFKKTSKRLVPLGVDLDGNVVYWNTKLDPHQLIVGCTGCGKSSLLNAEIIHITKNNPRAKLYLVDFKHGLEFGKYRYMKNVDGYVDSLADIKKFMTKIEELAEERAKKIKEEGYNDYYKFIADKPNSSMTEMYIYFDEFTDIMSLGPDMLDILIDWSRKYRALGIHITLATQRPTIDSLPSSMKANLSCIIGMRTMNEHNSRLVIDEAGLEALKVGESISVIGSERKFFKAYYVEDTTIKETIDSMIQSNENKEANKPIPLKPKNPLK